MGNHVAVTTAECLTKRQKVASYSAHGFLFKSSSTQNKPQRTVSASNGGLYAELPSQVNQISEKPSTDHSLILTLLKPDYAGSTPLKSDWSIVAQHVEEPIRATIAICTFLKMARQNGTPRLDSVEFSKR